MREETRAQRAAYVYFRGGRAAAKEISQGNKKAAQDLSVGRSGGDGVVKQMFRLARVSL